MAQFSQANFLEAISALHHPQTSPENCSEANRFICAFQEYTEANALSDPSIWSVLLESLQGKQMQIPIEAKLYSVAILRNCIMRHWRGMSESLRIAIRAALQNLALETQIQDCLPLLYQVSGTLVSLSIRNYSQISRLIDEAISASSSSLLVSFSLLKELPIQAMKADLNYHNRFEIMEELLRNYSRVCSFILQALSCLPEGNAEELKWTRLQKLALTALKCWLDEEFIDSKIFRIECYNEIASFTFNLILNQSLYSDSIPVLKRCLTVSFQRNDPRISKYVFSYHSNLKEVLIRAKCYNNFELCKIVALFLSEISIMCIYNSVSTNDIKNTLELALEVNSCNDLEVTLIIIDFWIDVQAVSFPSDFGNSPFMAVFTSLSPKIFRPSLLDDDFDLDLLITFRDTFAENLLEFIFESFGIELLTSACSYIFSSNIDFINLDWILFDGQCYILLAASNQIEEEYFMSDCTDLEMKSNFELLLSNVLRNLLAIVRNSNAPQFFFEVCHSFLQSFSQFISLNSDLWTRSIQFCIEEASAHPQLLPASLKKLFSHAPLSVDFSKSHLEMIIRSFYNHLGMAEELAEVCESLSSFSVRRNLNCLEILLQPFEIELQKNLALGFQANVFHLHITSKCIHSIFRTQSQNWESLMSCFNWELLRTVALQHSFDNIFAEQFCKSIIVFISSVIPSEIPIPLVMSFFEIAATFFNSCGSPESIILLRNLFSTFNLTEQVYSQYFSMIHSKLQSCGDLFDVPDLMISLFEMLQMHCQNEKLFSCLISCHISELIWMIQSILRNSSHSSCLRHALSLLESVDQRVNLVGNLNFNIQADIMISLLDGISLKFNSLVLPSCSNFLHKLLGSSSHKEKLYQQLKIHIVTNSNNGFSFLSEDERLKIFSLLIRLSSNHRRRIFSSFISDVASICRSNSPSDILLSYELD